MTEKEKIEILINKGWTCNFDTGDLFNSLGKLSRIVDSYGYVVIRTNITKKLLQIKAHRFIWYLKFKYLPTMIDHIDRCRSNNKLSNLRESNHIENGYNRNDKGYYYNKSERKYKSQIMSNGKSIHLGYFETEEEAREAYLKAKEVYHIIKKHIVISLCVD